jgi:Flp pilus assembly protein TadD
MTDTPRIEELRRRVRMDPASIAFAALAEELRKQGRFEEVIATCTAGLHRHPAYLSAHVTLGRALLEVGRYDEAREEFEHVLKVAPENLAAIRGLAEIHHRNGELPEVHFTHEPAAEPRTAEPLPVAAFAPAAPEPPPRPHPALAPLEGFLAAIDAARRAQPRG